MDLRRASSDSGIDTEYVERYVEKSIDSGAAAEADDARMQGRGISCCCFIVMFFFGFFFWFLSPFFQDNASNKVQCH